MERRRRCISDKLIVCGPATKKPADWKQFMANDENKQQLINLLLTEWQNDKYAVDLHGRQVTLICHGQAYLLTLEDGTITKVTAIQSLNSRQEETDTRIILYVAYAQSKGYRYARVKSPDSDVFFILLYYALTYRNIAILFDTGTGNNKKLLNITDMAESFTQVHCSALLSLHAFTGYDRTSALKGQAKVKPLKILQTSPEYEEVLSQIGDSWDVAEEVFSKLESFTCAICGKSCIKDVNSLHYMKISEICSDRGQEALLKNMDMASLPPCKRTLQQHVLRANYQVAIWRKSHIPNPVIMNPQDHGWKLVNGLLQPHWFYGEDIPGQLTDLEIMAGSDDEESDDEESDDDSDFEADIGVPMISDTDED